MEQLEESIILRQIGDYTFNPDKPIGFGSYGNVYIATHIPTGKKFAVKAIPSCRIPPEQSEQLLREINIQKKIENEHVLRFIDVKRTKTNFYIFTDLCEKDLAKRLKEEPALTEEEVLQIARQIAEAFISMGNLMHRDIKPANVLLTKGGKVKVADFGLAKMIDQAQKEVTLQHTILGTPLYMSPQILEGESYSAKCDIFSTGCLLYELLFKKNPWTGPGWMGLARNIRAKPEVEFPKETSVKDSTKDLLRKMLKYQESERIFWEDVLKHPALQFH